MIRQRSTLLRSWLAVLALVVSVWALPAQAQDLNQLRASGVIGERFDGYAEAIDPAYLDLVRQVNGQRNAIYKQRAAEQGVAPDQVGRVYATEIMGNAPSGTRFLKEDGTWASKP